MRRESLADGRARRAAVDDPGLVLEAALRFLEPRARSVNEVRRRLTTAGYRADLVDGAIDRLLDLGMLDDAAFARHWIESRDRAHPRGELALRRELHQKGIADDLIRATLAERAASSGAAAGPVAAGSAGAPDGDDASAGAATASADETAARHLIERRAASLARVADPRRRRQRAYALLARNGFDPETCALVAASVVDPPEAD
jgi:regulatory protein